eukprot:6195780-Pleurochrysis_carterae.AAC.1
MPRVPAYGIMFQRRRVEDMPRAKGLSIAEVTLVEAGRGQEEGEIRCGSQGVQLRECKRKKRLCVSARVRACVHVRACVYRRAGVRACGRACLPACARVRACASVRACAPARHPASRRLRASTRSALWVSAAAVAARPPPHHARLQAPSPSPWRPQPPLQPQPFSAAARAAWAGFSTRSSCTYSCLPYRWKRPTRAPHASWTHELQT